MSKIEDLKKEWQIHNRDNGMSWNEVAELVNQVSCAEQVSEEEIKREAKKHSSHIPDKQHRLWQHTGFLLGARWFQSLKGASTPPAQWISVEDKIPELHESVIIFKPSDFPDKVYVGWLSENNKWCEEDGPDGIIFPDKVSHWMPLPKPPKP